MLGRRKAIVIMQIYIGPVPVNNGLTISPGTQSATLVRA